VTLIKKLKKAPTEAALWSRIRHKFEQGGARVYRVEAVATPGFPDVVWCPYMLGPKFIELKAGRLKFRPAQVKFIKDITKAGCEMFVIWQKEQRGQILVYEARALLDWSVSDSVALLGKDLDEWLDEQVRG